MCVQDSSLARWPDLSVPVVSPRPKIEAEDWEPLVSASLADNPDSTGNFTWFSISSGGVSNRTPPNIGPLCVCVCACVGRGGTQILTSNPSVQGELKSVQYFKIRVPHRRFKSVWEHLKQVLHLHHYSSHTSDVQLLPKQQLCYGLSTPLPHN